MKLEELSLQYRASAQLLHERIQTLQGQRLCSAEDLERTLLDDRIHTLTTMLREMRELAVLTARYYERGYRRNAKYTI